jgi:uncharacterized protein
MSVNLKLSPEQMAIYRTTAKRRWEETRQQRIQRKIKAWELARVAANLLKEQFSATKVMVFGSLVRDDCFTLWSDVDIAAWGISPRDTFLAMDMVRNCDRDIELNLVDVGACKPELLASIEKEGILL